MRLFKWMILILVGFVLIGCGARLSQKAHKIKKGMNRAEVQKMLGKPHQVGLARMADYDGIADFYEQKDVKATVIYKEEKVELVLLNQEVMKFDEKK